MEEYIMMFIKVGRESQPRTWMPTYSLLRNFYPRYVHDYIGLILFLFVLKLFFLFCYTMVVLPKKVFF